MTQVTLVSMHVYPVKSCAGLAVDVWEVDDLGFRYDRRWMLVTPRGQFLTQREYPGLALVRPLIRPPHLVLNAAGHPELVTPLAPMGGRPVATRVWDDPLSVVAPDPRADAWFSEVLGAECVLVYFPDSTIRAVNSDYAPRGGRIGFSDGFPFLLIGEASLADLNARLAAPLPMNRFRPNLVVSGADPFAEDAWRSIRIGGIPMEVVKPCARCITTTTDQATGRRDGDEPLKTLATFRRQNNKVMFGQNVVHYGTGVLRMGDQVMAGSRVPST